MFIVGRMKDMLIVARPATTGTSVDRQEIWWSGRSISVRSITQKLVTVIRLKLLGDSAGEAMDGLDVIRTTSQPRYHARTVTLADVLVPRRVDPHHNQRQDQKGPPVKQYRLQQFTPVGRLG